MKKGGRGNLWFCKWSSETTIVSGGKIEGSCFQFLYWGPRTFRTQFEGISHSRQVFLTKILFKIAYVGGITWDWGEELAILKNLKEIENGFCKVKQEKIGEKPKQQERR